MYSKYYCYLNIIVGEMFPTSGLWGGQDEVRMSISLRHLVHADVVSAARLKIGDGDRRGGAGNIWRTTKRFDETPNWLLVTTQLKQLNVNVLFKFIPK